jgi:biotin carboxyl carrier protein
MRKFVINVNGKSYEVEVEEIRDGISAESESKPLPAAPAPKASSAPLMKESPKASGPAGSVKITAPMPGNIWEIKANPGDKVQKGQVILVLEAMKMENEIVAPQDGKVAAILVAKGVSVNAGDVLATME